MNQESPGSSRGSVNRWELPTARSVYVVTATAVGLELAHWGRPVPTLVSPFETPADVAALELTAAGTRHVQGGELLVQGPDGVDGTLLPLVLGSVTLADDGSDVQLQALLRDPDIGL
jgi:hypothetical protein